MKLGYGDTLRVLEDLVDTSSDTVSFDRGSRAFLWSDDEGVHRLGLSLVFPEPEEDAKWSDYVESLSAFPKPYLIVLIRAGSASLGFYMDGELIAHKVIRKYMVRKSQGRMQISYLNTKGKSRAGSRVRLRESLEFFEEINQKIADWIDERVEPAMIFHSCPVRLWSHWFGSEIQPPFASDDPRLVHIPHHVHQPDHDELLRINRLITLATFESPIIESPIKNPVTE